MSMAEQLITQNIETWTSAIQAKSASGRGSSKKRELYGIKKLRELILELAVRGKLVVQDPNDEPASVLLERIAAEKAELVKQKKIKKPKKLPEITEEEKPFGLPRGWSWIQLGSICDIERGGSPRPIKSFLTDDPDGLNWIKIGDTDIGGKYITSAAEKIRKEGLTKTRTVYPGDFLLTNSMSFGRPYITKIEGCIHDGWLRISPPKALDKDYLYSLLSSSFIVRAFRAAAAGAVVMNLNADKVRAVCIALPPSAEQHRIVAKVDELMTLCDQLEQQTESSLEAHATLVDTLLATLTTSTNADELSANWQRLSEHFDTLFTTEASIDQLKQTILQLAVMGKLVPQDPNDEPASELLKRIAAEKAELVKQKRIKKQKPLPPISAEEKPFELPSGWEWCRLGEISNTIDPNPSHRYPSYEGGVVPLLSTREFSRQDNWNIATAKLVPEEFFDYQKKACQFSPRDIVFARKGRLGLARKLPQIEKYTFSHTVFIIKSSEHLIEDYLLWLLRRDIFVQDLLIAMNSNVGVPTLGKAKLDAMPITLPPVGEQHRIVAKVDQLMLLCDQLKSRLSDAQQTQLHLADALVEDALSTKESSHHE